MSLHIAAWILVNWMLTIAWLDSGRQHYIFWAGVTGIVWWLAWVRRNPPRPARPEQRIFIYLFFLATTSMLAVFMGSWRAGLIFLEFIVLLISERLLFRRRPAV